MMGFIRTMIPTFIRYKRNFGLEGEPVIYDSDKRLSCFNEFLKNDRKDFVLREREMTW